MARVFISYVRENAAVVEEIAQALKNAGFEVWTDRRLLGGADWAASIRAQIEEGTHFIACFSKEYQQRTTTYMNEELDVAITELPKTQKRSNWFIPVRLDDSDVPDRRVDEHRTLRSFTHVALGKDWHLGIYQLVRSIDGDALMVAVDSTHLLAADSFILSGLGFPQDPFARDAFMNIVNVWCNLPHLFFAKPATVSTDLTPLLTLWHGAEAGGKLRPVSPLTPDLDRDLAARFLQWTASEEMSNAVFDWTSYQLSHERNSRIFWSGGTADVDTAATLLDSYQLISPLLNGSEPFVRRLSKTGIPLTGSNEIAARRFKSPEHFALAYAFFAFKKGRSYATALPAEPAYDCHWLRWAALPTGASSNSGAKSLRRGGVDWAKVLEPIFVVPVGLTESSITKGLDVLRDYTLAYAEGLSQRRELKLATVQQFLTTGLDEAGLLPPGWKLLDALREEAERIASPEDPKPSLKLNMETITHTLPNHSKSQYTRVRGRLAEVASEYIARP